MGSFGSLLGAIPGLKKLMPRGAAFDEGIFKEFEVMVQSMTPSERVNPDLLDRKRRLRIARGSGLGEEKVSQLLKQFDRIRKMARGGGHKKYLEAMMGDGGSI